MKNIFSQKKQLQESLDEIEAIRSHMRHVASRNARDNNLHFWFAVLLCVPLGVGMGILYTLHGPAWIAGLWYATAALWTHTAWTRHRAAVVWSSVVRDDREETP